jgi:hypothetical protein
MGLNQIGPDDNKKLSSVAHSRYRFAVSPPLLCRHICVFFPYRKQATSTSGPYWGEFSNEKAIDHLIDVFRKIYSKHGIDFAPIEIRIRDDFLRNKTARFSVTDDLNGFNLRVKADIYSETFTVTFFLDVPIPERAEALMRSGIDGLIEHWRNWINEVDAKLDRREFGGTEILHFAVWSAFEKFHNLFLGEYESGSMFGDFRGLAICANKEYADQNVAFEKARYADFIPEKLRVASPIKSPHQFFQDHPEFFYSCLGISPAGELLSPAAQHIRAEANIVLCEMLQGNAIYGSTLGNHHINILEPEQLPIPVAYFVIYDGRGAHQIGRLVQRMHALGELRLAALLDRETIIVLNKEIRELGERISQLLETAPGSTISLTDVRNVINIYTKIGTKCHGGLIYRGSRSRQYVAELHRLISDTRSAPIEGWQSYKKFIRRNVEHEYASIDGIVNRYITIGNRVDRLVSVYQIERQMTFAKEVSIFPALLLTTSIISLFILCTIYLRDILTRPWASYAYTSAIIVAVLCLAYVIYGFVLRKGRR